MGIQGGDTTAKASGSREADGDGNGHGNGDEDGTSSNADAFRKMHESSWLGARSPLMSEQNEPSWVLEHLSMTLERELKKQREEYLQQIREKTNGGDKSAEQSRKSQKSDGQTNEAYIPGGKEVTEKAKEEEKDGGKNGTVGESTKEDIVGQAKRSGP